MRPITTAILSAIILFSIPVTSFAHHYFANFKPQQIVLRGTLVDAFIGNPHGILTIEAQGHQWDAYLGAANHSRRLGLSDELFERGSPIVVYGHPSVVQGEFELMTSSFIYKGVTYEVFPSIDER